MKYILKEDFDKNDYSHLIEAENREELEQKLGDVKGYGVDLCSSEKADGIIYIQK